MGERRALVERVLEPRRAKDLEVAQVRQVGERKLSASQIWVAAQLEVRLHHVERGLELRAQLLAFRLIEWRLFEHSHVHDGHERWVEVRVLHRDPLLHQRQRLRVRRDELCTLRHVAHDGARFEQVEAIGISPRRHLAVGLQCDILWELVLTLGQVDRDEAEFSTCLDARGDSTPAACSQRRRPKLPTGHAAPAQSAQAQRDQA